MLLLEEEDQEDKRNTRIQRKEVEYKITKKKEK